MLPALLKPASKKFCVNTDSVNQLVEIMEKVKTVVKTLKNLEGRLMNKIWR